jgi:hypothetical protein
MDQDGYAKCLAPLEVISTDEDGCLVSLISGDDYIPVDTLKATENVLKTDVW